MAMMTPSRAPRRRSSSRGHHRERRGVIWALDYLKKKNIKSSKEGKGMGEGG